MSSMTSIRCFARGLLEPNPGTLVAQYKKQGITAMSKALSGIRMDRARQIPIWVQQTFAGFTFWIVFLPPTAVLLTQIPLIL